MTEQLTTVAEILSKISSTGVQALALYVAYQTVKFVLGMLVSAYLIKSASRIFNSLLFTNDLMLYLDEKTHCGLSHASYHDRRAVHSRLNDHFERYEELKRELQTLKNERQKET